MSGEAERIQVLVVDGPRVVREGMRRLFPDGGDVVMIAEASAGRAALDALARAKAKGGCLVTDVPAARPASPTNVAMAQETAEVGAS